MRYCPACGSLLDAKVENCPSCGKRATTVMARPDADEARTDALEPSPSQEKRSQYLRFVVPAIVVVVLAVAITIYLVSVQQDKERVQARSRPVLALLRANQTRCVALDKEIRELAVLATEEQEIEPIGAFLLGEASLSLAEVESSLEILGEITAPFAGESAEPIAALRELLDSHRGFARFVIDQPDGEPSLYAERSDRHLAEIATRKAAVQALVPLLAGDEPELLYDFQDRIADARAKALSYYLEEEKRRAEAAFLEVEAEDSTDMDRRIRQIENYELMKAGLENRDAERRRRQAEGRKVDPLAPRPQTAPLPTGEDATPEEKRLSAATRLWQPKVEEATRQARQLSAKILELIRNRSYPPDLLDDCRDLLNAAERMPIDRIFPTPEPFLELATQNAIDSWRVGSEQCLEENFFALDSNLTTGEESWKQIQDRILTLTAID